MNIFPVGTRWSAVSKNGSECFLYLKERVLFPHPFEDWRWTIYFSDGKYYKSDWAPSRQSAYNELIIERCYCDNTTWTRMKRTKEG